MRHPDGWLGDYYDHELSALRRQQVEKHLASCAACQEELASLRLLSRALAEYRVPDALAGAERFRARVLLRLPRRDGAARRSAEWAWWIVPLSLASVLVALVALLSLSPLPMWVASLVSWVGPVDPMAVLQAPGTGLTGLIGDLLRSTMLPLFGLALQMLLCALLVLLLVPYAGWISVLARARQRSDIQKGETRGPF